MQPSLHAAQVGSRSPKVEVEGPRTRSAEGARFASSTVPTTTARIASVMNRSRRSGGIRASVEDQKPRETRGADQNAPPGENPEAVARDVVEKTAHHDQSRDKGRDEADDDQR